MSVLKMLIILCLGWSSSLWASYSAPQHKFLYHLDLNTLASKHLIKVYDILADAEEALPPSFKQAFPKPITIKFESNDEITSQGVTMGWVKSDSIFQSKKSINTIYLNSVILNQLDEKKNLLLRVLLHETTHLFDYRHILLGQEKKFEEQCLSLPQVIIKKEGDKLIYGPNRHECVKFLENKYSISESPLFLTLSGWNLHGTIFKSREQINKNIHRSVDEYEFSNPRETAAVNMEFFLTDSEFQCRRPTLYKYFSELFDFYPFENSKCEIYTKVTTSSSALGDGKPQIVDLDLNRLYQVHYLFASEGEKMMSKWGHAMFRLVMCRPGRDMGPKCLDDIAYHVVLSFRANVDDTKIDYIKGMNGGYDSQLFILNMKDVIDEYTKGEFRDLMSIPLNYSEEQKKVFLTSTLEQYWSYLGSYYFISNNCATETMRMIRIASFKDYFIQDKDVFSPLGLMELLEENGISNMSVFANRQQAIKKGYLFPGANEALEKNYSALKRTLNLPYGSFKEFAEISQAEDRRHIFEELTTIEDKAQLRSLLAKTLQLEEYIGEYRQQAFVKNAADKLTKITEINRADIEFLKAQLESYSGFTKKLGAEVLVSSGYGIPTEDDARDISDAEREDIFLEIEKIKENLNLRFRELFPQEIYELEKIAMNKIALKQALFETF